MYSELPPDIRERHPYHMYDEIKAQPEAVARSLSIVERDAAAVRDAIGAARRVFVTGCGTSFHAAEVGAWMLRGFSDGNVDARAVIAFNLATYDSGLGDRDIVLGVSHSGTTTMTIRALRRAGELGARTVAITGLPEGPITREAEQVLYTGYPEERSWAHTVSYLAALASFAGIANELATPERRLDLGALPEVVREALQLEGVAHRMAAGMVSATPSGPPLVVLIGGGANAVTAREAVLKFRETSYVPAAAFDLEESLHGPLASVTAETLVIPIVPDGRSVRRAAELAAALRRIGVTPLALVGNEASSAFEDAHRFLLPDVPEVLSPLPAVVPLQFLSYFLAVGTGRNPDLIRRDEEPYRLAAKEYE